MMQKRRHNEITITDDELPEELWSIIFQHIELALLLPASMVSKDWRRRVTERRRKISPLSSDKKNYLLEFLETAARQGSILLLNWGFPMIKRTPITEVGQAICVGAAKGGHIQVLKWWKATGKRSWCAWDMELYNQAAFHGHLQFIKFMKSGGCPTVNTNIPHNAAYGGHVEIIQWAEQNGLHCTPETFRSAAAGGHIEILGWLRDKGCPQDAEAPVYAAYWGNLSVIEWLIENGCPMDTSRTATAAEHHPHVYKFISECGPTLQLAL